MCSELIMTFQVFLLKTMRKKPEDSEFHLFDRHLFASLVFLSPPLPSSFFPWFCVPGCFRLVPSQFSLKYRFFFGLQFDRIRFTMKHISYETHIPTSFPYFACLLTREWKSGFFSSSEGLIRQTVLFFIWKMYVRFAKISIEIHFIWILVSRLKLARHQILAPLISSYFPFHMDFVRSVLCRFHHFVIARVRL